MSSDSGSFASFASSSDVPMRAHSCGQYINLSGANLNFFINMDGYDRRGQAHFRDHREAFPGDPPYPYCPNCDFPLLPYPYHDPLGDQPMNPPMWTPRRSQNRPRKKQFVWDRDPNRHYNGSGRWGRLMDIWEGTGPDICTYSSGYLLPRNSSREPTRIGRRQHDAPFADSRTSCEDNGTDSREHRYRGS